MFFSNRTADEWKLFLIAKKCFCFCQGFGYRLLVCPLEVAVCGLFPGHLPLSRIIPTSSFDHITRRPSSSWASSAIPDPTHHDVFLRMDKRKDCNKSYLPWSRPLRGHDHSSPPSLGMRLFYATPSCSYHWPWCQARKKQKHKIEKHLWTCFSFFICNPINVFKVFNKPNAIVKNVFRKNVFHIRFQKRFSNRT